MAARDVMGKQFGPGYQGPHYLSRPGTGGADRVYFHNPWADFQAHSKMESVEHQRDALKHFSEQAYAAGYTNTRNWEMHPGGDGAHKPEVQKRGKEPKGY